MCGMSVETVVIEKSHKLRGNIHRNPHGTLPLGQFTLGLIALAMQHEAPQIFPHHRPRPKLRQVSRMPGIRYQNPIEPDS